jgi:outer membrane protein OmpA-like peptidoglycan-associated protein
MEDDNDNEHRGLVGWILGIAVTIAVTVALTSGIVATTADAPKAPATAAAPAAAAAPAVAVARIYFESGVAALPADAEGPLGQALAAARAGADAKVVISGFHDKTGNPEQNAELAKQRALAVRDALVSAGIPETRIELRKPVEAEGGTDDREARRVEVTVQ